MPIRGWDVSARVNRRKPMPRIGAMDDPGANKIEWDILGARIDMDRFGVFGGLLPENEKKH